jgi:hypothetical protein
MKADSFRPNLELEGPKILIADENDTISIEGETLDQYRKRHTTSIAVSSIENNQTQTKQSLAPNSDNMPILTQESIKFSTQEDVTVQKDRQSE